MAFNTRSHSHRTGLYSEVLVQAKSELATIASCQTICDNVRWIDDPRYTEALYACPVSDVCAARFTRSRSHRQVHDRTAIRRRPAEAVHVQARKFPQWPDADGLPRRFAERRRIP